MAKVYDVNFVIGTNAQAEIIYRLKEVLKTAGWAVKSSSDGATYNSTGDQITTAGAGAGGMNNNYAWFRIQDPGALREFTFQRGPAVNNWRMKYSAAARFTGGSPAATVTPSATDEQVVRGGGTDAAPTYSGAWNESASNYKIHIVARSDAVNGTYYWAWCSVSYPGNAVTHVIGCDGVVAGSHPAEDTDPAVLVLCDTGAATTMQNHMGWLSFSTASKVWDTSLAQGAGLVGLGAMVQYPGTTKDTKIAVYSYASTTKVIKGFHANMKYVAQAGRAYPSLVDRNTDAYLYFGAYLLPWPNGVDPT